jgi:hypothetical protein
MYVADAKAGSVAFRINACALGVLRERFPNITKSHEAHADADHIGGVIGVGPCP